VRLPLSWSAVFDDNKIKAVESAIGHVVARQQCDDDTQAAPTDVRIRQNVVDVGIVQEYVVKALDVKTQEDKEEEMEIKRKVTRVIVHGVAESDATDKDQREADNFDVIAAMMHELDGDDVRLLVNKIARLWEKANSSEK